MIRVHNEFETARKVCAGFSLARFGDGELNVAFLGRAAFDNYDQPLAERLRHIIGSREPGLLIGIPDIFSSQAKARLLNPSFWLTCERVCLQQLDYSHEYFSSFFSRPDNCAKTPGVELGMRKSARNVSPAYWDLVRTIWQSRRICIINSDPGLARATLINNAASIAFIRCPSRNAWNHAPGYEQLLNNCLQIKADLFLASAGPVGTVLAHDLHLAGRWTLDFGQLAEIHAQATNS
jgi:hypothetical protein